MMARAIFKRVLDIVPIKIGHLKGESPGSLDSVELDFERLKAAQRKELVVQFLDRIYFPQRL